MPLRQGSEARERVNLPAEGEWVDVRADPSLTLIRRIKQRESNTVPVWMDSNTGKFYVDQQNTRLGDVLDSREFVKIEEMVVDWSFAHLDEPVPLELRRLRDLDEASVELVTARIDAIIGGRSEPDAKN